VEIPKFTPETLGTGGSALTANDCHDQRFGSSCPDSTNVVPAGSWRYIPRVRLSGILVNCRLGGGGERCTQVRYFVACYDF
jgi:hypothetical protein